MRIIFIILVLLLVALPTVAQPWAVGWTDENDPPADYFILYRSMHPDTGYLMLDFVTPLEGTNEYMYADTTVVAGTPYYYRVSAVRDLDCSEMGPWSRGLWYDKSNGTYAYYEVEYWPGMEPSQNMLMVYTPLENCELLWRWLYADDLVAVKCAPFSGVVPPIRIQPQE